MTRKKGKRPLKEYEIDHDVIDLDSYIDCYMREHGEADYEDSNFIVFIPDNDWELDLDSIPELDFDSEFIWDDDYDY